RGLPSGELRAAPPLDRGLLEPVLHGAEHVGPRVRRERVTKGGIEAPGRVDQPRERVRPELVLGQEPSITREEPARERRGGSPPCLEERELWGRQVGFRALGGAHDGPSACLHRATRANDDRAKTNITPLKLPPLLSRTCVGRVRDQATWRSPPAKRRLDPAT